MNQKLKVCGVSYSYHSPEGETPALSHISFTVPSGEFLAVVGPSGCGKSTLLSLLCGLIKPEEGSIFIDDIPVGEDSGNGHAKIGYMLQKDHLFEWRTIYDNAALGLEIQKKLNVRSRRELSRMLNTYGLGGFEHARPSELSGGMRQRAALIRTLALKPDLLLLDEPFSALDSHLRDKLQLELRGLLEQFGRDTLLVTHSRDEAYHMCARIAVMDQGRLLSVKETKSLFADPGSVCACLLTGCKTSPPPRRQGTAR